MALTFWTAGNLKIIEVLKLIDGINLEKEPINANKNQDLSFESKSNNNLDSDTDKLFPIHKAININVKTKLRDTFVKNKYIRIVKSKR